MSSFRLSDREIKHRLTRLKNLERLYGLARARIASFEHANRELKMIVTQQTEVIETLKLRIEELSRMIWGRRGRGILGKNTSDQESADNDPNALLATRRNPLSYRRPIPHAGEITHTETYPIDTCTHCHAPLTQLKTIIRYTEDMVMPTLDHNPFKKVVRQRITTGYCSVCRIRRTALPIQPQVVSLGENVKQLVSYASVVLRLSYAQTQTLLKDLVELQLSDGEIRHILAEHAANLQPRYHHLTQRIRAQPGAHYDETGWNVAETRERNFAWVMTGTRTAETIFLLGRTRGKGNAQELKGEAPSSQVGITDDYGAYRTLFERHQLSWAKPYRNLRELAYAQALSPTKQRHCQKVYAVFAHMYQTLRRELAQPYVPERRVHLHACLMRSFGRLCQPHPLDPVKLKRLKGALKRNQAAYFTCLTVPGIPPDNNKAERALRHLVLKRKAAFGSKTHTGAHIMSVLFSTLLSLWWSKPKNFFVEYTKLLQTT